MSGYPFVELGRVVTNYDSRRVPLSSREREKRRGRIPYYGATGIIDYVDEPIFSGLHLLMGEDGSVARPDGTPFVTLADGDFWVNNHAHVLRGESECDTRFIFYALSITNISSQVTGAVQAKLNQRNMNQILIPFPEPSVRELIVATLGALDDKIEQNRRTSEALERLGRAVFRAWFVDFEPVKAKAAGAASFPSMPQDVFDALPTEFVDSPIGPIPQGWEAKPLGSAARFLNGLALQKFPPRDDGFDLPVIKIAQLRKGATDDADRANSDVGSEYVIADGDLLFSWSGSLMASFWFGGRGALNQHLFKVTSDDIPQWLSLLWIREHLPHFQMIAASKATTMGHIKRSHLNEVSVVIPTRNVLNAADEAVGAAYRLYANLQVESRKLAELRDYLLPKLLSGKVRVKDAECLAESPAAPEAIR